MYIFCSSLKCQVILLFLSAWIYRCSLNSICYHYLFDVQIWPVGSPSSWLLCSFDMSPLLEHILDFCQDISRSSVLSLLDYWNKSFSFLRKLWLFLLENNIWKQGPCCSCAYGYWVALSGALTRQSKRYRFEYTHTHTHSFTHIYTYLHPHLFLSFRF